MNFFLLKNIDNIENFRENHLVIFVQKTIQKYTQIHQTLQGQKGQFRVISLDGFVQLFRNKSKEKISDLLLGQQVSIIPDGFEQGLQPDPGDPSIHLETQADSSEQFFRDLLGESHYPTPIQFLGNRPKGLDAYGGQILVVYIIDYEFQVVFDFLGLDKSLGKMYGQKVASVFSQDLILV